MLPIAELDCFGPRRCAALHSSLFLGQASKLLVPNPDQARFVTVFPGTFCLVPETVLSILLQQRYVARTSSVPLAQCSGWYAACQDRSRSSASRLLFRYATLVRGIAQSWPSAVLRQLTFAGASK